MKVYDCFTFFNELDLLELRMTELDPIVDYFVIVEATRTFQKKEKPLFFQKNRARYSRFEKKIIHVLVDNYPTIWTKFRPVTTWHYENNQREHVYLGLKNARPEDIILFSDLDEIPSASAVAQALSDSHKFKVFEQFQAIYFLNNICRKINDFKGKAIAQKNKAGFGRWRGSVLSQYKNIHSFKEFRKMRDQEASHTSIIPNAGWHLSFMGGIESVIYKMKSYSHTEYSGTAYTAPELLVNTILNGTDPINSGEKYELADIGDPAIPFLPSLLNNIPKFQHMIKSKSELLKEFHNLDFSKL